MNELATPQDCETIRELREKNGWTQAELADRAGLTPTTISNIENGLYQDVTLRTRRSLIEAFSISVDECHRLLKGQWSDNE